MSDQLLTILKFCLLALIYLFFLRVLRAVWAEITPPKTPAPTRGRNAAPVGAPVSPAAAPQPMTAPVGSVPTYAATGAVPAAAPAATGTAATATVAPGRRGRRQPQPAQLVVVEPPPLRGRSYAIGAQATLGRAPNCDVRVEDTFVSQVHARVSERQGSYVVEDLGSTNGTFLNRNRLTGPMVMQRGDRLQVGNTVLELV